MAVAKSELERINATEFAQMLSRYLPRLLALFALTILITVSASHVHHDEATSTQCAICIGQHSNLTLVAITSAAAVTFEIVSPIFNPSAQRPAHLRELSIDTLSRGPPFSLV